MSFQERKKEILNMLNKFESLSVLEISQKLSASPATVRRDLLDLSNEGLLIRTHGGAMRLDDLQLTNFNKKQTLNIGTKEAIGKAAAGQVKDGDIIFMDCGSTVFAMCPHLKQFKGLKVITNSLPIVAELMTIPGITINLVGGELDAGRRAIHGNTAIAHIDQYQANKAFIGIDGLSVEKGLSSYSEKEAGITKAFIRNAEDTYLLCDSSKIGKDVYLRLGPLSMIKYLVTDNLLNDNDKKRILKTGIRIIF